MATNHHGLFGWLWSLIGSTTPAYSGTGQPVQARGSCGWLSTTPAYEVAPVEDPKVASASEKDAEVGATESVKDSGNGLGRAASFAIVIQRE